MVKITQKKVRRSNYPEGDIHYNSSSNNFADDLSGYDEDFEPEWRDDEGDEVEE